MERHKCRPGLCYFCLRSVLLTQNGLAVCVTSDFCKMDTVRLRIVFLCAPAFCFFNNDRLKEFLQQILKAETQFDCEFFFFVCVLHAKNP